MSRSSWRASNISRASGWPSASPPTSWSLSAGWQGRLRELSSRGDILKQIHDAISGDPAHYQVLRRGNALETDAPASDVAVTRRVASKGLSDELKGGFFAVIETPSGHAYHVPLDARSASELRPGDIVSFTTKPEPPVRAVDRQLAEMARVQGGSVVLGEVTDAAVQPVARRLRELERLGLASQDVGNRWRVSPDLVRELEERHRTDTPRHRVVLRRGGALCRRAGPSPWAGMAGPAARRLARAVRLRRRGETGRRPTPRGPTAARCSAGRPEPDDGSARARTEGGRKGDRGALGADVLRHTPTRRHARACRAPYGPCRDVIRRRVRRVASRGAADHHVAARLGREVGGPRARFEGATDCSSRPRPRAGALTGPTYPSPTPFATASCTAPTSSRSRALTPLSRRSHRRVTPLKAQSEIFKHPERDTKRTSLRFDHDACSVPSRRGEERDHDGGDAHLPVVASCRDEAQRRFRIQSYKTITDTGWVKVRDDVTCMLGKNESGKSAVMQAIWKFKNARGTG